MWHSEIIEISNIGAVINEGVKVFLWHPDNADETINLHLGSSSEHPFRLSFPPLPEFLLLLREAVMELKMLRSAPAGYLSRNNLKIIDTYLWSS